MLTAEERLWQLEREQKELEKENERAKREQPS